MKGKAAKRKRDRRISDYCQTVASMKARGQATLGYHMPGSIKRY